MTGNRSAFWGRCAVLAIDQISDRHSRGACISQTVVERQRAVRQRRGALCATFRHSRGERSAFWGRLYITLTFLYLSCSRPVDLWNSLTRNVTAPPVGGKTDPLPCSSSAQHGRASKASVGLRSSLASW
jgi:hypothetical protein